MHLSGRHSSGVKSFIARPATPIIFVLDDDASFRKELGTTIGDEGWQLILHDCAEDLLSRWDASVPCCLVLGSSIQSLSAVELIRRIFAARPDVPVIFIAEHSDVPMAMLAMKAGAREVLTRHFDTQAMLDAIRNAIRFSEAAQQRETSHRFLKKQYATLSKRERDVMSLVVRGLMNKQVGAILEISEITVKAHRGKAMQKMQAANFADLVYKAARLGFEIGRTIETKSVSDLAPYKIDILKRRAGELSKGLPSPADQAWPWPTHCRETD